MTSSFPETITLPAAETLVAIQRWPLKSIAELAAEQGTRPLSFEEMLGDFWPEDESVDDFLAALMRFHCPGSS